LGPVAAGLSNDVQVFDCLDAFRSHSQTERVCQHGHRLNQGKRILVRRGVLKKRLIDLQPVCRQALQIAQ
jgi:hypothetical protein